MEKLSNYIFTILVSSFISIGASYFLFQQHFEQLELRLQESPPVVVVDFAKIASSYPEGASSEELEPLMIKTNDAIFALKQAGYLVLDTAGGVIGAPEALYLPDDVIQDITQ